MITSGELLLKISTLPGILLFQECHSGGVLTPQDHKTITC